MIMNSIQERTLTVSREVAERCRGALWLWDGFVGGWGAAGWGGQFSQSALNRAVLCLCDCQVGHYFLIRALFPLLSLWLGWACCSPPTHAVPMQSGPSFTELRFSLQWFSPQIPRRPPANTPANTSSTYAPTSPLKYNVEPFTPRRKGHPKLLVSIVNHPNWLISMK